MQLVPLESRYPLRIIYIEDNVDDAFIFKLVTKKLLPTLEIIELKDGQELMDFLNCQHNYQGREKSIGVHLVLMDINMPKINGVQALELIQSLKNQELLKVPIVMLSTSASESDVNSCKALGAVNYIVKPHFYNELIEMLTTLIQEHFITNPAPATLI